MFVISFLQEKIFGADYSKVPPLPLPQRETILNWRLLLPLVF
jgi:hypothetical protein